MWKCPGSCDPRLSLVVGSGELPHPEDKKVEEHHKEQQADLLPQEVKWLGLWSFQLPSPKGNFKDSAVTEKTLAMSRSASTQYYKLSPPITACVFSATQALSHLFKRRVDSVTERSYPKSHTELGIRTHQVALWQCKTWYLLTSQWKASMEKKKLPTVIWGIFHFHTSAQGTIYWLQVHKPWEMAGFLHGCFGCVPHFRPLFQTVSFVWALAGRKTENANECLCCEHNMRCNSF